MSVGRPALPPRRQVILRLDEGLLVELYTFHPELQATAGGTKYGALTKYFTSLVVRDLQKIKDRIREGGGK